MIGAVALVKVRLPAKQVAAAANRARDEIEQSLIEVGYLDQAPFKWVGLIVREGLKDETSPHYQRINKTHGDLPLAIEIDTHRLLGATEDEMVSIFRRASLISLIHAGEKYGLPVDGLRHLADSPPAVVG